MKRYERFVEDVDDWGNDDSHKETMIIGTAREIRSLERNMAHREFQMAFCEYAQYNENRMYGIMYSYDGRGYNYLHNICDCVWVINEHSCLMELLECDWTER